LLKQGREDAAVELALADRRVLRPLLGRLWDPDREIRCRAARTIGRSAPADPDSCLELIRRLMWALNDESTTNGVHAIPALGEIGRNAPEMIEPFVPALVSMSWDAGIRLDLLLALTAVAESAPHLVADHLPRLAASIDDSKPDQRQALERLAAVAGEGSANDC